MRALALVLLFAGSTVAADIPQPKPTKADEPIAKEFSLAKAGEYLDGVGVGWTRDRQCVTCHTNMPYVMARPLVKTDDAGWKEVRAFLEKDVASWKTGKPRGDAYVVATATGLAFLDANTTGKLSQATKDAFAKMWQVQQKAGYWNWLKCDWPPMEHDDYYGAVLAAVAVGTAPGEYAKSADAKEGLAKLTAYLKKNPAPDLHHRAMLLWASTKIDGLMTAEQRNATVADLVKLQHTNGGWSLASLGTYMRKDKSANDPKADSDGYATGFASYVLNQADPNNAAIAKGVAWLKANQRESGRWFTRSLNNDKAHYIANAGTAFAVMAIQSASEKSASK
jgi:squalene-hopene/tetraprenyl-beta-curcumene cyclase